MAELKTDVGLASVRFISGVDTDQVIRRAAIGQPYNPRKSTLEQGLPSPFDEAKRVRLIA